MAIVRSVWTLVGVLGAMLVAAILYPQMAFHSIVAASILIFTWLALEQRLREKSSSHSASATAAMRRQRLAAVGLFGLAVFTVGALITMWLLVPNVRGLVSLMNDHFIMRVSLPGIAAFPLACVLWSRKAVVDRRIRLAVVIIALAMFLLTLPTIFALFAFGALGLSIWWWLGRDA